MGNNKIKIFIDGKYTDYDFNDFIYMFVKNGFIPCKNSLIEAFVIEPLKIEEQDKQRVIDALLQPFILLEEKISNYAQNKQSDNEYQNDLTKYLITIQFCRLNNNHKIAILKKLNVNPQIIPSIVQDFSLSDKK